MGAGWMQGSCRMDAGQVQGRRLGLQSGSAADAGQSHGGCGVGAQQLWGVAGPQRSSCAVDVAEAEGTRGSWTHGVAGRAARLRQHLRGTGRAHGSADGTLLGVSEQPTTSRGLG